jgi:predicted nucleotide-binding protein (sugar kinase/HSP70/actin superfamily)
MGNVYLAGKALFDGLGIDYVIPPLINKTTLDIGSLNSTEEICLPYKLMVGNYIQSIEQGADTIIITGSCGPCRFGEYCEMQMNLLKNLGKDLDFIVVDMVEDIGVRELYRRIKKITSNSSKSKREQIIAFHDAIKVLNIIDELEQTVHYLAGYEKNRGEGKELLNNCKKNALEFNEPKSMIKSLLDYKDKINHISIDVNKNPIKIAIIGEIYTIIEPFANLYIEDKLMDLGVSTKRRLTPSWWVKDAVLKPIKMNSLDLKKSSKRYLSMGVGGHARECVGEAVLAFDEGFDGAIQIFPMGCMPEIVSKSILPSISKDKDFPIMSLVVDEMTGEAGYLTRIEAFIDLLERRRENVLSRS